MQAKMERVEAKREAKQRRMVEILQYMKSFGAATGVLPPPSLFSKYTSCQGESVSEEQHGDDAETLSRIGADHGN